MADIPISIAAKVAEYFVDPIIRRARYLFRFNQIIREFEKAKADLESTLECVKEHEREVTRRTEEITQPVKKWLHDVDNVLKDVPKVQEKATQARLSCLQLPLRYMVAKEMQSKMMQMVNLKDNSKIDPFSLLKEIPGINYFPSKDFTYFNSTTTAFNMLLKAFKDDKNEMVGMYGMGGSGKTTLAKEFGKKVEELKLFDKVVIAIVSQPLNVVNVQGQIADQLGQKLIEETPQGRAQRLWTRLQKERILIILDDVWSKLNLEDIGIPLPSNDDRGCCVLITTRLKEVCDTMDCKSTIQLSLLTEEEAWGLFMLHANITNDSSSELRGVAWEVADECKGLPIAIVTVGSTLKGKSLREWRLALKRLKESKPMDIAMGLRSPYACLELSYNNLTNSVAKSIFLLCSMFPEDYDINREGLIRLGKGVVELDDIVGTMEEAREEMYVAINILLDSCLLMPSKKQDCVKMHDLVRDVALWIASKESQAIMVDDKVVRRKFKENETLKDTKVISLWNLGEEFQLPNNLNCPTLKILLLHSQASFQEPNIYPGGMKALKVLALLRFSFQRSTSISGRERTWSMPKSIGSLTNLHTLCIRGCILGDISFLGTIKGLEILDLRGSSFDELPGAIADMKELKLLDLFQCSIGKSPYEVIGKCSQLQELDLWDMGSVCPTNVSFPSLQRYAVFVSTINKVDWYRFTLDRYYVKEDIDASSRTLFMEGFDVSVLSSSMKDLFLRADILQLKKCRCSNTDFYSLQVRHLGIESSPQIKFFVGANIIETEQAFSHLATLRLEKLEGLERVFQDSSINFSLQKLEELHMLCCPKLHDISFPQNSNLCLLKTLDLFNCPMLQPTLFTPSVAKTLVLLRSLRISCCGNLKHVIEVNEKEGKFDGNSNQDPSLMPFQNLRELGVYYCNELESILPLDYAQYLVKLEYLEVSIVKKLKYVFGGRKEDCDSLYQWNEKKSIEIGINMPALKKLGLINVPKLVGLSPNQHGLRTMMEINMPALKTLSLCFMPELIGIVPQLCGPRSMVTTDLNQLSNQALLKPLQDFLNLEDLQITGSGRWKGIYEVKEERVAYGDPIKEQASSKLNLNISSLYLVGVPEIEFIWKSPKQSLSLQRLNSIHIVQCPKLNTIFTSTITTSIPKLETLTIYECNELEGITYADSNALTSSDASSHSDNNNVCFPTLSHIRIRGCNKLKYIFTYSLAYHCPSLTQIYIEDCYELERVLDVSDRKDGDDGGVLFPALSWIFLRNLPKLTEIFPSFEYEGSLDVKDCPNLQYTSSPSSSGEEGKEEEQNGDGEEGDGGGEGEGEDV